MLKCKYCKKTFKSENWYNKHKCKYMFRKEMIDNTQIFKVWMMFKTIFKIKVNKDLNKEEENFIKSDLYNKFFNFYKWACEIEIFDIYAYILYLKEYNIPLRLWNSDRYYKLFLSKYVKEENLTISIERCEKNLKKNNLSLETITQNRLYMMLYYGLLTKKYLDYKNYNYKNILDTKQLEDLKDL